MRKAVFATALILNLMALAGCALFLNQQPVARFAASLLSGTSPLRVDFDAGRSYDPDGSIVSYKWDFADGSTDTGKTTSHTFTTAATQTYTVRLTVTDDDGAASVGYQSIEVLGSPVSGNNAPTARFTATPTFGNSPLTVQFNASSSTDADGTIALYSWDFGDNSTGAGEVLSHTFTALGTSNLTVGLTVTDNQGATATTTTVITVLVPEVVATDGPTASFTVEDLVLIFNSENPSASPTLYDVTFDPALSTAAPGGHYIEIYLWKFGDGEGLTLTTDATVVHRYELRAQSHTFVVTLTVIDEQGLRHSAVRNVTLLD